MIYLIIAIVCGSLFAVVLRLFQQFKINSEQGILFNYITGTIVSLVPLFAADAPVTEALIDNSVFSYRIMLTAMIGALFTSGFIIMDMSTWRNGIALTTVIARASLMLPVVFSWLFLNQQQPSWLAVMLVLIALLLIVLPNRPQERSEKRSATDAIRRRKALLTLTSVFLVFGTSDFLMKILQYSVEVDFGTDKVMSEQLINMLTATIFVMASIFALIICLCKGSFRQSRTDWRTIVGGVVLGIINTGSAACMLRGLGCLPTSLYYPVYNIGIVSLATIIGVIFFHEKIKPLQVLGLALAVVAIALNT